MIEFGNKSFTQVFGNKRAIIESCDSVIDFDDNHVLLKSGKIKIRVEGEKIKIVLFVDSSCVIEGTINSIKYLYF